MCPAAGCVIIRRGTRAPPYGVQGCSLVGRDPCVPPRIRIDSVGAMWASPPTRSQGVRAAGWTGASTPTKRDVEGTVPYEKPSYLSAGYVACVLPAKVGNSLVKEGGIRYNHTRNCTGKGDASMYGIGQQAVHPVHGAGITEGVPEELPHAAAVMTGVCE